MHTHIGLLITYSLQVLLVLLIKQRNNTANIQMLMVIHNHDRRKVEIIMIMKNTS